MWLKIIRHFDAGNKDLMALQLEQPQKINETVKNMLQD